jgi:hypothetical protein
MEQRAKRKEPEKLMSTLLVGVAFSAMLLVLCHPVEAQQAKKVPRIGVFLPQRVCNSSTGRGVSTGVTRARVCGGTEAYP